MCTKPLFVLLTGALFLSGCHSTPPGPVTDACSVLTPDEISAVLRVPIDPGKHIPASSTVMCAWLQSKTFGITAEKLVLNFTSLDSFKKEKVASSRPRKITVTPVSGIGDEAFYVITPLGTSLYIRKGNTAISFTIRDKGFSTDQLMAKEKTLGLEAAARL
jgi:hypothetical protein